MCALFRLAFASAPVLNTLTSLRNVTRRPVLQKVRHHTWINPVVLCLLVSIGFQVLFHSPPGVLFTFPSRYYTLSVTRSYLALGDGPPVFPPDFSCPVVLWILLAELTFQLQDCHFLWCGFLSASSMSLQCCYAVLYPIAYLYARFGLFPFRSPLLRKSFVYFLFLRVIRCFSSPGSLPIHYVFMYGYRRITNGEFPHSDIYGSMFICNSP